MREDCVLVFGRHPASPTFRALLADVSSTRAAASVEHRDARSAFITRGGERNQPRLVGAPSSLLGLPRPGPPARGSGALRRGFLFQLLAERPAYAGRERDARGLVIFKNPSQARWRSADGRGRHCIRRNPGRPPRRYTYEEGPSKCPFFLYRGDC